MHDIKFRGKDINTGEWRYGYYVKNVYRVDGVAIGRHEIINDGIRYEVVPETVGRGMFLKDRNGKYVHEGDVVTKGCRNEMSVVCYGWGEMDSGVYSYIGFYLESTDGEQEQEDDWKRLRLEVVGTIYDNPELLTI